MKKNELIDIIYNSPICQTPKDILQKMTKAELQDMYDMLDEYEEDYYNSIY